MGIERREQILGVQRTPCGGSGTLRIVSHRRWALALGPVPVVALDARWRTCADGRHRFATPRFTIPTAVLVTLLAALAVGQGWLPWTHPVAWGTPLAFWTLWGLGRALDHALNARLDPVPRIAPQRAVPPPARRVRLPRRVRRALAVTRVLRSGFRVVRSLRRRRRARARRAAAGPA